MANVSTRQIFRGEQVEAMEVAKRTFDGDVFLTLVQGDNVVVINEDDFEEFVETVTECAAADPEPDDEFDDEEDDFDADMELTDDGDVDTLDDPG